MKICPRCSSTYSDETLIFCLQDGAELRPFEDDTGETETVISNRIPEPQTVQIPAGESSPRGSTVTRAVREKSKLPTVLITVFVTMFVMAMVAGSIGIGLWYYSGGGELLTETDGNANRTNRRPQANNAESNRAGSNIFPETTPMSTGETIPTPTPAVEKEPAPSPGREAASPTPIPTVESDGVKSEVAQSINSWKSLAETRSLGAYMGFYGDRIDYYRKKGASRAFVQNDKRRAFSKYSTIRIRLGPINTSVSNDGRTATSTFDKEWLFANSNEEQTGKVRTRLVLVRSGDRWKIVSEKDVRVYYVDK